MNRRDFLRFRIDEGLRYAVLSCQQLYMHHNHQLAQAGIGRREDIAADDWWLDEPSLAVDGQPAETLFLELGAELAGLADVLVLTDRDWLQDSKLADLVEALMANFRAGGGEVRMALGCSPEGTHVARAGE